jgi:hypothetical protein
VKRITVCSEAQQVVLTRIASVYIEDYKTILIIEAVITRLDHFRVLSLLFVNLSCITLMHV